MYMEWPFQIYQTSDHIAMTFEWQRVFRLIYTIEGWPARNGTPTANASRVTLPDGRRLFSGSAPR